MQMTLSPIRISIVGSGNVATRLCYAFRDAGVEIVQLLSTSDAGEKLSELFGIQRIDNPEKLAPVEVVIVSIKDDALQPEYLSGFRGDYLLCHSSGSVAMDVFGEKIRSGVFYPLQTLSDHKEIEFDNIPVCIEAKHEDDLEILKILASKITKDVREIDSEKRMKIHLAAVFVSNFANHLYKIAGDLLKESHLDFDILKPLIAETASKVQTIAPEQAQTGPALRNDLNIINKHLDLLNQHPDYQDIYRIISKSITKHN